ncbi:hypothetical protein BC826DRAFT_1060502 [Russula brevipes]|nr:hypothetical protein BC826DRAFT_1060502 [Russula brevipes]
MAVGRTSTFIDSSTRIFTATLLAGFLPGVRADCWRDGQGRRYCNGLSDAARAGIGLAFFLVFLAAIFAMLTYRKRRAARANLAYVQQAQAGAGAYGPQYGPGGPGPYPQYPPQAYNSNAAPYAYDPSTGFAPPTNAEPPQYYAPPLGTPPVRSQK